MCRFWRQAVELRAYAMRKKHIYHMPSEPLSAHIPQWIVITTNNPQKVTPWMHMSRLLGGYTSHIWFLYLPFKKLVAVRVQKSSLRSPNTGIPGSMIQCAWTSQPILYSILHWVNLMDSLGMASMNQWPQRLLHPDVCYKQAKTCV